MDSYFDWWREEWPEEPPLTGLSSQWVDAQKYPKWSGGGKTCDNWMVKMQQGQVRQYKRMKDWESDPDIHLDS